MAVVNFLGTFRLVHRDANNNTIAELVEKLASEFGIIVTTTAAPFSDPQQMPKVKKPLSTILKQDDKLVIMLKAAGAQVVGSANLHQVRIPVTFRNVRTGITYEKTLNYADFTTKFASDLASPVMIAGNWLDWLEYTIPAQSEMKLGHNIQDVRVDSALLLALDLE
jgi:hypothetical protein